MANMFEKLKPLGMRTLEKAGVSKNITDPLRIHTKPKTPKPLGYQGAIETPLRGGNTILGGSDKLGG